LSTEYPALGASLLELRADLGEQIQWLQTGVEAARALGERRTELRHLQDLSDAYLAAEKTAQASDLLRAALDLAAELGDELAAARIRHSLGNARLDAAESDDAIAQFEQALQTARAFGD